MEAFAPLPDFVGDENVAVLFAIEPVFPGLCVEHITGGGVDSLSFFDITGVCGSGSVLE